MADAVVVESPHDEPGDTLPAEFRPFYALIELRRRFPRFLDMRGEVAEDLLAAYGNITFLGESPGGSDRLAVEIPGSERTGAVDWRQAVFEDGNLQSPDLFLSEAPVFLRRVERKLGVRRYDRVGVKVQFSVTGARSVVELATQPAGGGWTVTGAHARLEAQRDGWGITILAGLIAREPPRQAPDARAVLDIDQYRLDLSATDGQQVDLPGCWRRATDLAAAFVRDGIAMRWER
jgi:hypothetical protein